MCLLLTDVFFLNVKIVAFTGEPAREQPNLAASLLKYIAFVPGVALFPLIAEPWIEKSQSILPWPRWQSQLPTWRCVAVIVQSCGNTATCRHWKTAKRISP